MLLLLMTAGINPALLVVERLNKNVLNIPNFVKNSKCDRLRLQDEDCWLSVSEKTVGCRL